jgi:hypothetical protein
MINEITDEPLSGKGLQGHGPLWFSKYIREFANLPQDCNIYQHLKQFPHEYIQCDSNVDFENGKFTRHLFLGSSKTQVAWKNQL